MGSFLRLAALLGSVFVGITPAVAQSWSQPHADAANSNFVDVATALATDPVAVKTELGTIAPGVGPVITRQGRAIIGNSDGRVFSIGPTGTTAWTLDLPRQRIFAPAVAAGDSSVYVVGSGVPRNDHRDGGVHRTYPLWLNHIDAVGTLLWTVPFPDRTPKGVNVGGGVSTAPPVLGHFGTTDVVLVSVVAPGTPNEVYLEAFGPSGAVLAIQQVGIFDPPSHDLPDHWWCYVFFASFFGCGALPPGLPDTLTPPEPGPTIVGTGADQLIVVTDEAHDVAGFVFDPASGFVEKFRDRQNVRLMTSGFTALPDGHTMFGRNNHVSFSGPNAQYVADINHSEDPEAHPGNAVVAPPTQLPSGRVAVLGRVAGVTFIDHVTPVGHLAVDGDAVGSAAASRNIVYVSAENAFLSIDPISMQILARYPWTAGGVSTPAISSNGRVYAVAANQLYIFPPPGATVRCGVRDRRSNLDLGRLRPSLATQPGRCRAIGR